MLRFLSDIYVNLCYRVGCAALPVVAICYGKSAVGAWLAVTVMFSCITMGAIRGISIKWFDKETRYDGIMRNLVDDLLALPYGLLLMTLVGQFYIIPGENMLYPYLFVIFITVISVGSDVMDLFIKRTE